MLKLLTEMEDLRREKKTEKILEANALVRTWTQETKSEKWKNEKKYDTLKWNEKWMNNENKLRKLPKNSTRRKKKDSRKDTQMETNAQNNRGTKRKSERIHGVSPGRRSRNQFKEYSSQCIPHRYYTDVPTGIRRGDGKTVRNSSDKNGHYSLNYKVPKME